MRNNTRMKKITAIFLLACLAALLLIGCTDKPGNEASSQPAAETEKAVETTQGTEPKESESAQTVPSTEQETEIVPDTTPTTTTKHMIPEPTQAQQIETENTGMEIVGDVTVEIGPGAAVGGD